MVPTSAPTPIPVRKRPIPNMVLLPAIAVKPMKIENHA